MTSTHSTYLEHEFGIVIGEYGGLETVNASYGHYDPAAYIQGAKQSFL